MGNTLYCQGVDQVLRHCLSNEEVEMVLNDFHSGYNGGHLSALATTQKIFHTGYFWLLIFKYCIEVFKKCHMYQVFTRNMHTHPDPLFPIIIVVPFTKWRVDFMTYHPALARGTSTSSWSSTTLPSGSRPC
jgi:hypothetical protein